MRRIASLPMYDVPELQGETDALWAALAHAMRAEGVAGVPDALTRDRGHRDVWVDPTLLLGQTCGYPFANALHGKVQMVATPRYAVPECAGAFYTSRVVVRIDSPVRRLDDLLGGVCAANESDSHSGMSAMRALIAPVAHARGTGPRFFSRVVFTGSHRASLEMVARGDADVASIDAVTFALTARVRPDLTDAVRDLARTAPCPGLPMITSLETSGEDVTRLRAALARLFADEATAATRATLLIDGFDVLPAGTYDLVHDLERSAVRLGYPALA